MKIVLIISFILTISAGQQQTSLSCIYYFFGDTTYGCELTINNPNGLNNFTEIGGLHLEGFTNDDVAIVYKNIGFSTNIPSIICNTFSNLMRINFYNTGLTEINDNALCGCVRVTDLYLATNRITSISVNAFVNLRDINNINLEDNWLATLPEDVFANQRNLTVLVLSLNHFENIPVGIFRPLENLHDLYISYCGLNAINNQWFTSNKHLQYLHLVGNIIALSADSFDGLEGLRVLHMGYNEINDIPAGVFDRLESLQYLYLDGNNVSELQTDSFPNIGPVIYLDLSLNPIEVIHNEAFRGLLNLTALEMTGCRLRQLNSNSFVDLDNLEYLYLNFNEIEELPNNIFVPLSKVTYIGLWNNRVKTLRRNSFGSLTTLKTLDLDENIVNALDREIIVDAVNLDSLHFSGNLCANNHFGNFFISRAQYFAHARKLFRKYEIYHTITEGGDEFSFFVGPHPGIVLRVNSDNEVQIALTPFNFIWNPIIEIFIGTSNNTRSIIRMNQERNVVTVPTPNIIKRNQWNDFRITWANQIILVYSGNDRFPFMSFTMQDFVPINFYGLRAVETRALWSVQPF